MDRRGVNLLPDTKSKGKEVSRIAVLLDVENLMGPFPWGRGLERHLFRFVHQLDDLVSSLRSHGEVVYCVGSCGRSLSSMLALPLAGLGLRLFRHSGGRDAADLELLQRLDHDLPSSVDCVVVGSGDHAFAPACEAIKRGGRRVVVVAKMGSLSAALAASNEVLPFPLAAQALNGLLGTQTHRGAA